MNRRDEPADVEMIERQVVELPNTLSLADAAATMEVIAIAGAISAMYPPHELRVSRDTWRRINEST